MTTTIRLDFEPSLHHPGVTYAAIRAELQRELAARGRLYPKRVESGRLTPADAARECDLIAAMLADVTTMASYHAADAQNVTWRVTPRLSAHPEGIQRDHTWEQRRMALHRELDLRRRIYPQWIAEGRLTQPDATRQLTTLDCLLSIYDEGWGFPLAAPGRDAERSADFAATVWPATRTAQSRTVKQEEMAL